MKGLCVLLLLLATGRALKSGAVGSLFTAESFIAVMVMYKRVDGQNWDEISKTYLCKSMWKPDIPQDFFFPAKIVLMKG